jgi:cysteine desulfurase/selenocysteine lyase
MNLEKNIERIRGNFPHLEFLIHLGACGAAPLCLKWYNALQKYWQFEYAHSQLSGKVPASLTSQSIEAKMEAAKLINAEPTEICWINRVLQGLNMVKDVIDYNYPWEKGDNVVFTDQGYPSSGHTWLQLRKKGVEIHRVKNVEGKILLHGGSSVKKEVAPGCWEYGDMDQAIDEKTKLACINRTTWHCGFTYDVEAVCELAHEKGAFVVDDAYQALGARVIDVHKDEVDFLVSGSHKWQCGPPLVGMFYVRKDLCEKLEPSYWSYLNVDRGPWTLEQKKHPFIFGLPFGKQDHDNIKSYDMPFPKTAERFDQGIGSTDVLWGWLASLRWLNELGKEDIQKRVVRLGGYLIDGLLNIGCKVNTPVDPKQRHGLINYTTGSYGNDFKCYEAMATRVPKPITGPTIRYQGEIGGIRVCTHFYNTEEDVDKFIDFQKDLMPK